MSSWPHVHTQGSLRARWGLAAGDGAGMVEEEAAEMRWVCLGPSKRGQCRWEVGVGVKPAGRERTPQRGLLPGEEEPQLVRNAEAWLAVFVSRSLLWQRACDQKGEAVWGRGSVCGRKGYRWAPGSQQGEPRMRHKKYGTHVGAFAGQWQHTEAVL